MSDLTIESLEKAMRLMGEMDLDPRRRPWNLPIISSVYAPAPFLMKYPRKGPYYKRRLKKLQLDPKNWSKPEYFIVDGAIVAHPSVVHLLHAAMAPVSTLPRV